MASKALQGFTVLELKLSDNSPSPHHLFVKKHCVRNQEADKPAERTLFVLNIPPYVTEANVKSIFSVTGHVNKVLMQNSAILRENEAGNKSGGYKVAYVIYKTNASLEKMLKLKELPPLSNLSEPIVTGLNKYIIAYNASLCDHQQLQKLADEGVAKYDRMEAERKRLKNDKERGGWTVVGKKRKKNVLARKESAQNRALGKLGRKQTPDDFYTFQKREAKQKQISEIRKKFDEDKRRVEEMKKARRFRPY